MQSLEERITMRQRKKLGYKTPYEVFSPHL